jgi:hypothetical protein
MVWYDPYEETGTGLYCGICESNAVKDPHRERPTQYLAFLQRKGERLARVLSDVSNPLFVALPTFLVIALASAPDAVHAPLWWAIAVIGISLASLLFILRAVFQERYSNHHGRKREQRCVPLLFGIGCMSLTCVLLIVLYASPVLIATCCLSLLNWKISLHLVGSAGAITVCALLFGPRSLWLSPPVALVGWARRRVHAHTLWQILAGSATVLLFRLFDLV